MEFYIDIGFAVLLRVLKDRKQYSKMERAFRKLYDAIGVAFPHFATPGEANMQDRRG